MSEIKEVIKQVAQFLKSHQVTWFRGHSDTEFKLNSGLYRIKNDKQRLKIIESNLFNAFLNYGDAYCNSFTDKKNWNIIFLMQHYGLYTRLLDWTDSFIVALYFAIQSEKDTCIWMLDPIKLNQSCKHLYDNMDIRYTEIRLLTLDTLPRRIADYTSYFERNVDIGSFAILPRRSNERLLSQSGCFTIQGTDCLPLEEEYHYGINDFLQKIDLPKAIHKECRDYLKINGINYYSLYGGIDGLCKFIKSELFDITLENV